MIFYKINQISNVRMGLVAGLVRLVIPKIKNGFIVYNCNLNTFIEKDLAFDVYNPFFIDDHQIVIPNSADKKSYLFEITVNNMYLSKEYEYNFKNCLNNKLIITGRYNDDFSKYFTGIYDIEKEKIVWEDILGGSPVDSYLIAANRVTNLLYRLSIATGEVLWSYSFAGYPKAKDVHRVEENVSVHNSAKAFTGVINNQLWVTLNTWQHLVLDIDTGEQIALLGNRYNYNKPYEGQHFAGGGIINKANNKVISLGNALYREIDCSTFEITFIDLREEFQQHDVNSIGDIILDDDYLYFYDKKFMGINQCCKVAVLDRKTLKVVWTYDFAQHGSFPMQMEKTERHLFVLDGSGTLHIFEKG